ncbi:MAG: hypothetical protein JO130_09105, partial [Solirubrobacterales bacterium]|nr:hypothetical protein [Solirubrobacterales bacterium]
MVVAGLIGGSRMFWGNMTTTTTTTSAPATKVTDSQCPKIATGRTQTIGGKSYALEGLDTFTKAAPLGSFASSNPDRVVYRGDHGMAWTEYPDGWPSTYSAGRAEGYQPST